MRFLRQNAWKARIFHRCCFKTSAILLIRKQRGCNLGLKRKQAQPLTTKEEEELWNKKDHNPQALLNTVIFMVGLYFALRSGDERRQLHHSPCQIQLIEKLGERPYLIYTEDRSKINPGGLKGQKYRPNVATAILKIHVGASSRSIICFAQSIVQIMLFISHPWQNHPTLSCTLIDGTSCPMLLPQCKTSWNQWVKNRPLSKSLYSSGTTCNISGENRTP